MSHWERPGLTDEWNTPAYIFEALGVTFNLDAAAPSRGPMHVPCRDFFYEGSLDREWRGFVWMNPPFGGRNGLRPWLEKIVTHGCGIALVPDRTSAEWFQAAAKRADAILFVSPKVKFIKPDGSFGESPSTGTALLAFGTRARAALIQGRELGLLTEVSA